MPQDFFERPGFLSLPRAEQSSNRASMDDVYKHYNDGKLKKIQERKKNKKKKGTIVVPL